MHAQVRAFFDPATWTLTYVVFDAASRDAVVIDPVLDYDPAASRTSERAIRPVIDFIEAGGLKPWLSLETHAHADHLTAAQRLKDRFPGLKVGIGARITEVQRFFATVFNLDELAVDGSQFDLLLHHGQRVAAGSLEVEAIATPGHTPACMSFRIGDAVFTGDALFMPDYGTGRCDFPAGSAAELHDSIAGRLYALPDATRVFVGHDYQPGGRDVAWESTIGEQKRANVHLRAATGHEEFVAFRRERDRALSAPRLLYAAVQFNINAGLPPPREANGTAYLKIPLCLDA
jgi:glyoxylase-like metal-dependent hydrolase (beta-lactamase superfamily II)